MGNVKAISARPWSIYTLTDPRKEDAVRYVGVTVDPTLRMRCHLSESRCKNEGPYKRNWIAKLLREGVVPVMSVIQRGEGGGWKEVEKRWISHYRSIGCRLTNVTDGGEGTPGLRPTPETIEKLKAARRRQPPRSPEILAKMSASQKGKPRPPLTPEQKIRHLEALHARIGYKASPESRANMSRAQKGIKKKPPTQEQKDAMSALHPFKAKDKCKNWHMFDEKNTYIVIRKENGREQRKCRECRRKAVGRAYRKRKQEKDPRY